jgi:hypothetical protein
MRITTRLGTKSLLSESYHFVSFWTRGQRSPEAQDHVWFRLADPLRRRIPAASLLRPPALEEMPDPRGTRPPAQQPLQHGGDVPGVALPDDPRARTNRDDAAPAAERRVPVPHGAAELPRRDDPATLPAPRRPDSAAQAPCAPRSIVAGDGGTSPAPDAADLRRRLHGLGGLRPSGAGPDRLQPDQAGPPLVSPVALLRGPDQGLLARRARGPATPTLRAGRWTSWRPASRRSRPASACGLSVRTKGFSPATSSSGWRPVARGS